MVKKTKTRREIMEDLFEEQEELERMLAPLNKVSYDLSLRFEEKYY